MRGEKDFSPDNFLRLPASICAIDMNMLLENPLPILAVGAVLATLCGLVFLSRRSVPSLLALSVVLLLTLLLVLTERLIVTPREEVEQALSSLLTAVESNELSAVLAMIDPTAVNVRDDAEALMPMVDVTDTGASSIKIDVEGSSATVHCRGKLRGTHRNSGVATVFFGKVEFQWVRRGEQWLLKDFIAYWKGKPLNAVESLNGKRVSPATR